MVDEQIRVSIVGEDGLAKPLGSATKNLTAFEKTSKRVSTALPELNKNSRGAGESLMNLSRIAQDAPFGFIGIGNNINPLLESLQRLRQESGSTGGVLRNLAAGLTGAGGLGLAVGIGTALFTVFNKEIFGSGKAAEEAGAKIDAYSKAVAEVTQGVAQEAARVASLVSFLKTETATRRERVAAIKELQAIAPSYFGMLDAEKASVGQVTQAYNGYLRSLRRVVEAKVIEKQLGDAIENRLALQSKLKPNQFTIDPRTGNKIRNAIYEDHKASQVRIADQNELNRLLLLEERLATRLGELKPPDLKLDFKETGGVKEKIDKWAIAAEEAEQKFRSFGTAIRTFFAQPIPRQEITVPLTAKVDISGANPAISKAVQLTRDQFEAEARRKFTEAGIQLPNIDFGRIIDFKGANDQMDAYIRKVQETASTISGVLTPAFQGMFSAILEGENPLQAFFKSLAQSVVQLITKLIAATIQAAVLKSIAFGGGAATFGIGKAIGSILSGAASLGGAAGIGGGAAGGVGLGGSFSSGGISVQVGGEFRLQGSTLVAAVVRTNQSQGRNG